MSKRNSAIDDPFDAETDLYACKDIIGFCANSISLWAEQTVVSPKGLDRLAGLARILWSVEETLEKSIKILIEDIQAEKARQGGKADGSD